MRKIFAAIIPLKVLCTVSNTGYDHWKINKKYKTLFEAFEVLHDDPNPICGREMEEYLALIVCKDSDNRTTDISASEREIFKIAVEKFILSDEILEFAWCEV